MSGNALSLGARDGGEPHGRDPVGRVADATGLSPSGPGSSIPVLPDGDPSRGPSLDDRLKAAGMFTVAEMMGETPLTRWEVNVGMDNLDFFGRWLDRKVEEYIRMRAAYLLGEKDASDELHEWVLAHSAAFSTIRTNFKAAIAAGDWQPIAMAPKDGKPVDLWGYWPEHDSWKRSPDACWDGIENDWRIGWFTAKQFTHRPTFTHWMRFAPPALGIEAGTAEGAAFGAQRESPVGREAEASATDTPGA